LQHYFFGFSIQAQDKSKELLDQVTAKGLKKL
jgi:hypothetical protein